MSEAVLNRLTEASEGLILALDKGSAEAVEQATQRFSTALKDVQAIGGWHGSPEVIEKLQYAMKLADAARARVNYLTDINRRRFESLCKAAGIERPSGAYDRRARVKA
jgi:hypothetical protein